MFKILFLVKIKVCGLNLNRLIINLEKNKIFANNFVCLNVKTITFNLTWKQFKRAKQYFKTNGYQYEIIEYFGIPFLLNFFKKNLGLAFGFSIIGILIFLSNLFIWQVQIFGLDKISQTEICNVLNVKTMQVKTQLNTDDLENKLYENIEDISLCSVNIKGLSLIVNIKEKTSLNVESTDESENIISSTNGVIKNITVQSGTANVEVGDTVKIGDILILGSFKDINSKTIFCKARGKIVIERYVYGTSTLLFEENVQMQTGKVIVNEKLSLFGMNFIVKNNNNTFENYEEKFVMGYVFKNNLIPMKIEKQIFYETESVKVERNLSEYEEEYKLKAKEKAESLIKNDMKILEQISFTSNIDNGIIFTYGFKVEQVFNFN